MDQELETHKKDGSPAFPLWHLLQPRFSLHLQILDPESRKHRSAGQQQYFIKDRQPYIQVVGKSTAKTARGKITQN